MNIRDERSEVTEATDTEIVRKIKYVVKITGKLQLDKSF